MLDTGVRGPLLSQPIFEHLQEAENGWDPGGLGLFVKPPPETMSHGRDACLEQGLVCQLPALPMHIQGSQQWVTEALGAVQAQGTEAAMETPNSQ